MPRSSLLANALPASRVFFDVFAGQAGGPASAQTGRHCSFEKRPYQLQGFSSNLKALTTSANSRISSHRCPGQALRPLLAKVRVRCGVRPPAPTSWWQLLRLGPGALALFIRISCGAVWFPKSGLAHNLGSERPRPAPVPSAQSVPCRGRTLS